MEKREVGRKSTRTVPVIIENHENVTKKTKLMVPSNYTAAHLVNILRSRMHLLPYHPVYLFLKSKQSPVLMSKNIGHLHHKHRDEKGLLRLIHAEQASFGFRGNIRAIRFRQKWIENLHNTWHHDADGPPSYSGVPPPYFPLEPPSTANFGAPLDVDDISNSVVQITDDNDYYDYMANSFMLEMEDALLSPTDMPNSWQASSMTGSSQAPSALHSSQSSTVANSISSSLAEWADPWLSSSLADPWLPSTVTNSGPTPATTNSLVFLNSEEEIDAFNLEVEQVSNNIYNAATSGNPIPPIPNFSVNIQPAIVESHPGPHFSLYESDSDFYDSDKDVDMDG